MKQSEAISLAKQSNTKGEIKYANEKYSRHIKNQIHLDYNAKIKFKQRQLFYFEICYNRFCKGIRFEGMR